MDGASSPPAGGVRGPHAALLGLPSLVTDREVTGQKGAGRAQGWIPVKYGKTLHLQPQRRGSPELCRAALPGEMPGFGTGCSASGSRQGSLAGLCHRLSPSCLWGSRAGASMLSHPLHPSNCPWHQALAPLGHPSPFGLGVTVLRVGRAACRRGGQQTPQISPGSPAQGPQVRCFPSAARPARGGGIIFFTRVIILAALESSSSIKQ